MEGCVDEVNKMRMGKIGKSNRKKMKSRERKKKNRKREVGEIEESMNRSKSRVEEAKELERREETEVRSEAGMVTPFVHNQPVAGLSLLKYGFSTLWLTTSPLLH